MDFGDAGYDSQWAGVTVFFLVLWIATLWLLVEKNKRIRKLYSRILKIEREIEKQKVYK